MKSQPKSYNSVKERILRNINSYSIYFYPLFSLSPMSLKRSNPSPAITIAKQPRLSVPSLEDDMALVPAPRTTVMEDHFEVESPAPLPIPSIGYDRYSLRPLNDDEARLLIQHGWRDFLATNKVSVKAAGASSTRPGVLYLGGYKTKPVAGFLSWLDEPTPYEDRITWEEKPNPKKEAPVVVTTEAKTSELALIWGELSQINEKLTKLDEKVILLFK